MNNLFDIRYELKREIEATTSLKCCVIYGNLPVRACVWMCEFGREFGRVSGGLGLKHCKNATLPQGGK